MNDLKIVGSKDFEKHLKSITVSFSKDTDEYAKAESILRTMGSYKALKAHLEREEEPEQHREEMWWLNRQYRKKVKIVKSLGWRIKNILKYLIV